MPLLGKFSLDVYLFSMPKLRSDCARVSCSGLVNLLFSGDTQGLAELILNSGHVVTHHLRDNEPTALELKFNIASRRTIPLQRILTNLTSPSP